MIVILTGSTGMIGGAVLQKCLESPSVSQIFAITRRSVPEGLITSNPNKLTTIIHEDFHNYPDTLLDQLSGADGCIWSLGSPFAKNVREIDIEYTLNAAHALIDKLQLRQEGSKKFKFVFLSGQFTEADQNRTLWFLPEARHSRGDAESKLLELDKATNGRFDVSIVRPGVVAATNSLIPNFVLSLLHGIQNKVLATAMLKVAQNRSESKRVYNDELVRLGGQD